MDTPSRADAPGDPNTIIQPSIGSTAIFAGDWSFYRNLGDIARVPIGFPGVLVDWWNGHAVFTCERAVAAEIVAEQDCLRAAERQRLVADGVDPSDLDECVDHAYPPMFFDGDDIVTDESVVSGEPVLYRSSPSEDGRYTVNGRHWTWQLVDPADCDRIAG